jgi:hypothetical protein
VKHVSYKFSKPNLLDPSHQAGILHIFQTKQQIWVAPIRHVSYTFTKPTLGEQQIWLPPITHVSFMFSKPNLGEQQGFGSLPSGMYPSCFPNQTLVNTRALACSHQARILHVSQTKPW